MSLINFQCSDETLVQDFRETCKRLRYSQSEVLRHMMASFVSRNREATPQKFVIPNVDIQQGNVSDIHIDDLLGEDV